MANVLLVEDDPHINNINMQALASEGYSMHCATTVEDCFKVLGNIKFDLILLDIDLPDGSGLHICEHIKEKQDVPIIFLTAMGENSDIVKGLDVGGDDYITKPYDLSVLKARVKARLRSQILRKTTRTYGKLQIDNVSGIAHYDGIDLLLTKRELLLLWILVDKKGEQINRDELYRAIWGHSSLNNYNALRVLVSRVKSKLANVGCNIWIDTEREKGYTLYGE